MFYFRVTSQEGLGTLPILMHIPESCGYTAPQHVQFDPESDPLGLVTLSVHSGILSSKRGGDFKAGTQHDHPQTLLREKKRRYRDSRVNSEGSTNSFQLVWPLYRSSQAASVVGACHPITGFYTCRLYHADEALATVDRIQILVMRERVFSSLQVSRPVPNYS